MTLYLGCDPGTRKNLAIVVVDDQEVALYAGVVGVGEGDVRERAIELRDRLRLLPLPSAHVLCVEWQRPLPTDKRPVDICNLAAFTGIALSALQELCEPLTTYLPTPEEWKGSVPKAVHHERLLLRLGDVAKRFNKGDLSNVLDAYGLALWAKRRHELLVRARSRLAR